MSRRYFAFESITGIDENQLPKIEFATDTRSEMRFEALVESFEDFRSMLFFVDYFTMLKPANYDASMIEYRDWYANELIRRVTSDTSFYETQPDAKKEVLRELLIRRNKLMKQLERTMNFYNDNKHQIDEVEKVRNLHQKPFPGPMMSVAENCIFFENISEYGDIYYQVAMEVSFDKEREIVQGSGWLEYSKYFSNNLKSLSYHPKGLNISNSKPRTDIRVLRRGDARPSRVLEKEDNFWLKTIDAGIIEYFKDKNYVKTLSIDKSVLYRIVNLARNGLKDNTQLILNIKPSQSEEDFVTLNRDTILIGLTKINEEHSLITNSSVFFGMSHIMHLIEDIELWINPYIFGTLLKIKYGKVTIHIHSNPHNQPRAKFIRKTYQRYLANKENLAELLSGRTGRINEINFNRMDPVADIEQTSREIKAGLLLKTQILNFKIEDGSVLYDGIVDTRITLENDIVVECTCNKIHRTFFCPHSLACIIFGYEGGYFNA